MLHHRDPAVVGRRRRLDLALGDVLEVELVELLLVGVRGRAGEGVGAEHGAGGHGAVAQQLHVQLRVARLVAHVDHFVAHADDVVVTLEHVGLDVLQAADRGAFEAHLERVLAVGHRARTGLGRHGRQVVGEGVAGHGIQQAGLRDVARGGRAVLEQHDALGAVGFVELEQFEVIDRGAFAVDRRLEQVGGHHDLLARRGRSRLRRHGACGATGCGSRGRHAVVGGGRTSGRRRDGGLGRRQEGRLVAVEDLPLVPQQHERETKNHPQDRAADIVHDEDFLSEERRDENSDPDLSVRRCDFGGTGSWPPWHQGWQRAMRCSVR
ncbi:hypothetical protein D9M68_439080 [compost metagenome]